MLLGVFRELRYSIRMLVRNRGFTAIVVLTLAVVIGATTAVFSVLHAVLLKPLPFPDPERLVMIWNLYGENRTVNSPPDYFDRLEFSTLLEEIAAFRLTDFNLTGNGDPERVGGARVTAGFFDTLGVRPMLGRAFLPEEDQPETGDAAVVSQGCWVRTSPVCRWLGGRLEARRSRSGWHWGRSVHVSFASS